MCELGWGALFELGCERLEMMERMGCFRWGCCGDGGCCLNWDGWDFVGDFWDLVLVVGGDALRIATLSGAMALKLVEQRARDELGLMGGVQATARSDIPRRTDREPAPPLSESKVMLNGAQGGNCNGCGTHFLPQHLTVDHIIAQSRGVTDHLDNLQLLCGHCNSLKGRRAMGCLRARLVGGYG